MITTLRLRAALLGSGAVVALIATPALAGQTEDLKAQIDQLQSRLDQIEKQQQTTDAKVAAAPADAVVGGDFPGSFKLPGSDTSFAIHGYVKLDFIYDADQALGDSAGWTGIQANGTTAQRRDGIFRLHAKQSRINFQSRTPTDYGQLKTYIEGDFLGAIGNQNVTNSTGFRLRHAYGELGPVLAGQTWTNFMSVEDLPETLDFNGPVGQLFVRQGQVRYTQSFGKFTASASLENPHGDVTTSTGATSSSAIPTPPTDPANNLNSMPDITAKVQYTDSWGHLAAAGVVRRFETDNGGGGETGLTKQQDSTTGGGGLIAGTINVGNWIGGYFAKDQVGFQGYYGSGVGRYAGTGGDLNQAAVVKNFGTTAVTIETQVSFGGFAWVQHAWTSQLRSNLVYGIQRNHISDDVPQSLSPTDRLQSVHANLIWSPVKAVNIGLEFMYGERDIRRDPVTGLQQTGDAKRVQASLQYLF